MTNRSETSYATMSCASLSDAASAASSVSSIACGVAGTGPLCFPGTMTTFSMVSRTTDAQNLVCARPRPFASRRGAEGEAAHALRGEDADVQTCREGSCSRRTYRRGPLPATHDSERMISRGGEPRHRGPDRHGAQEKAGGLERWAGGQSR